MGIIVALLLVPVSIRLGALVVFTLTTPHTNYQPAETADTFSYNGTTYNNCQRAISDYANLSITGEAGKMVSIEKGSYGDYAIVKDGEYSYQINLGSVDFFTAAPTVVNQNCQILIKPKDSATLESYLSKGWVLTSYSPTNSDGYGSGLSARLIQIIKK